MDGPEAARRARYGRGSSLLGTSSPRTTCKIVSKANAAHHAHPMRHQRRPFAGNSRGDGAQKLRECDFSYVPEGQAGEGDTDLNARHNPAQISEQRTDNASARVALFRQLADARGAHGDKRKFRGCKECVDRDQDEDTEEAQKGHGCWLPAGDRGCNFIALEMYGGLTDLRC